MKTSPTEIPSAEPKHKRVLMSLTKTSGSSNVSHLGDIQKLALLLNLLSQLPWCSTCLMTKSSKFNLIMHQATFSQFQGREKFSWYRCLQFTSSQDMLNECLLWEERQSGKQRRRRRSRSRSWRRRRERKGRSRWKQSRGRERGGQERRRWRQVETALSFTEHRCCEHLPRHPQMLACHCPPSSRVVMTPSHIYSYIGARTFPWHSPFGSNVANCQHHFEEESSSFPSRKCKVSYNMYKRLWWYSKRHLLPDFILLLISWISMTLSSSIINKNNVIMEYIAQVKLNYLDSQEMSSYQQSSNLREDQETQCHPLWFSSDAICTGLSPSKQAASQEAKCRISGSQPQGTSGPLSSQGNSINGESQWAFQRKHKKWKV